MGRNNRNLHNRRFQHLAARLSVILLLVMIGSTVGTPVTAGVSPQAFVYTADSGTTFTLIRNGDLLELRDDANGLLASRAFDATSEVMINGADLEDDTLTVDLSGGNPIPPGGIRYEGGAGAFDTIAIQGGNPESISHQPLNANDGIISIDGLSIHYSGLEPIIDASLAAVKIIIAADSDNTITLSDDGTVNDDLSLITIPPFESYNFSTPTNSLDINALAGNDTINYNGVDALFDVNVSINIDGGDPSFGDAGVPPGDTLNYNVGTGTVVLTGTGQGYIDQAGQPRINFQNIETLAGSLSGGYDFGDAPDPAYPTLLASDGARHQMGSGLYLGACADADLDGQPNAAADGDNTALSILSSGSCATAGDDENGVTFTGALTPGSNPGVDVTASEACLLSAWIDFNADGDWADAGEQIFTDQALVAGVNSLSFPIPVDATLGETYSRFRVSSAGGLTYTGEAADGEVEDYLVTIAADQGPASIPTLNEWGMIIFMIIAVISGWYRLRRNPV